MDSSVGAKIKGIDEAELRGLNAKLLHMTPFDAVVSRLMGKDESFWLAVRGNIEKLADVEHWAHVIAGPMLPVIAAEDREFIAAARVALSPEPWDGSTWKVWTEAVKAATGRKGRPMRRPVAASGE